MSASPIVCTSDLSEASRSGDPRHLAGRSHPQNAAAGSATT